MNASFATFASSSVKGRSSTRICAPRAWDSAAADQKFPARINIVLLNEIGALAQVTQVIGDQGGNIDELQMMARQGVRDFFDLDILLEVHDARHLNDIITGLRTRNAVSSVTRATG